MDCRTHNTYRELSPILSESANCTPILSLSDIFSLNALTLFQKRTHVLYDSTHISGNTCNLTCIAALLSFCQSNGIYREENQPAGHLWSSSLTATSLIYTEKNTLSTCNQVPPPPIPEGNTQALPNPKIRVLRTHRKFTLAPSIDQTRQ